MAADFRYRIDSEFPRQFNIEGYSLNFNIYDTELEKYIQPDINNLSVSGSLGTSIVLGESSNPNYSYKLTINSPSESISDDYSERVVFYCYDELCLSHITIYQINDYPKNLLLYVGEAYYFIWTPGVIECINVLDKNVVYADHSRIVGLKGYSTSINLMYLLDDNHTPYISDDITIEVQTPSIYDTQISDITYSSARLSCSTLPINVDAVKFRYGPKNEFNPEDNTTYIEVEASLNNQSRYYSDIYGLSENTEYSVQAVMYAFGNIYYDNTENYITFHTKSDTGEVVFDRSVVHILSTESDGISLTAIVDNVNIDSYRWYTYSSKILLDNIDESQVLIKSALVDEIDPEDEIGIPLYCEVTTDLGLKLVGVAKVDIYGVQGVINIYIDESIPVSTGVYLRNSLLTYNSITTDQSELPIYEYDPDTDIITALAIGDSYMTANVTLPESSDLVDKSYTTRIIIRGAFTAPTLEEIISRGVIYNYPEELFGANGNRLYKELNKDNKDLPHCYCFKTNGNELPWEYDIALMDDDIDKFNLNKLTN